MARGLGERRQLLRDRARDVGEDDLLLLDPEPARVHAREVEQVGGELREAVDLLLVVARKPARVSSSRSSSAISSRKPAREKSGVRSSCEAFATNSLRAVSSCESWMRISSNAIASSPSSSSPRSTTGSSNWPSAILFAARSRRRMRRAWTVAAAVPRIAAIRSATPVA